MNQAEQDLLVLAAQDGNHQAFRLLFNQYHQALMGFAFKLANDKDLASDAVQEAWIKAARNIRQIRDPRAFRSWIYRLVRWKTLDLIRQASARERQVQSLDEQACAVSNSAAEQPDASLSSAIDQLPATEKQMIHLFYLDELPIAEIALVLDIPSGTVKSRLNRARKRLKQKYEQLEKDNEYR